MLPRFRRDAHVSRGRFSTYESRRKRRRESDLVMLYAGMARVDVHRMTWRQVDSAGSHSPLVAYLGACAMGRQAVVKLEAHKRNRDAQTASAGLGKAIKREGKPYAG